jgi:hypothetical protein
MVLQVMDITKEMVLGEATFEVLGLDQRSTLVPDTAQGNH